MPNKYLFPTIFFLLPILFLPFTPNIFETPKVILLVIALLIIIGEMTVQAVVSRSLKTSSSPLRFALWGFMLAIVVNYIVNPEARTEALVGPGSIYLALAVWSYFLTLDHSRTLRTSIIYSLLGATSILALHSLLQLTFLSHLDFLPLYMQSRSFTLSGNPLTTAILMVLGLSISIVLSLKSSSNKWRPLFIFTTALHTISFITLGFLLMPGQELSPLILPLSSSWNIALDAMKPVRSLILGVGLANYGDFASSVKPLLLNATPFWNQSIVTSGSELLQILTTTGLIGLFSVLAIPVIAFRFVRTHLEQKPKEDPTLISIIALAVISGLSLVVFPGSLPVLFVFFSAVGLLCATSPHSHSLPLQNSLAVATVGLIIFVLTGFYSYKVYAAEWHLHNAQVALAKNDGKTVYEQNLAAIKLLPTLTSYRLSYSQVNLSLASALSQKSSLSDADRQNVTQLVSQAVVEAKTATGLRPHSAATWQNLGTIYRNLINVAEGADQFAITAYAQAISLDPGNPTLRVEFGGLLYQLGTSSKNSADQALLYDRARNELQTAISLKSDYANAYYNLSKLLETTKDYGDSYLAMQKAISLLGHDSQDLGRATSELEMIKAKLPTRSTSPSDTGEGKAPASTSLSNPSPLPSPISGDKIPLPSATP